MRGLRLLGALPSRADVAYFLRALATRPGDLPGILRREAARRRAPAAAADPDGLAALIAGWEAALAAGCFRAPPGRGPALELRGIGARPMAAVSALQTASAVRWSAVEAPAFPPLALEAARLGLPQTCADPDAAQARMREWAAAAAVSAALRAALLALADAPVGRA